MEICVIENGAMVKLKATLARDKRLAEEASREERRQAMVVEPLAMYLFSICAKAVNERTPEEFHFGIYISGDDLFNFYKELSVELRPNNFEKKCNDFEAAFKLVKEMLEKANYSVGGGFTYSYNWYCRSDRLGYISFTAED